jgi:hypothetical protein
MRWRGAAVSVATVLVIAACGGQATPSSGGLPTATSQPTSGSPSYPVPNTPEPGSPAPSQGTDTPAPTIAPSPSSPAVSTSPATGPDVSACSGSADNRDFFASLASKVDWAVYCAVLPAGWYVQTGSYTLPGGGQLDITYKGPGGVHLQLKQGNFCTSGQATCEVKDQELGPTAYGDQTGTLVTLDPGYAVYVNAGQAPSWSAASVDLDETTFVRLVAALHHITP